MVGDLTKPAPLGPAIAGVDAIVFTHGSDTGDKSVVEAVIMEAFATSLQGRTARHIRASR